MIIKRLETSEEYIACEKTMKEIWKFDDRDVIPHHILKPINENGGLVLGAFDNGLMVGLLVGFLAYYKGKLHHHSHVTGVLNRYKGVGYQLKQKQREFVISQGLELVTWTFDPLQSSNAYFNFAKLGVVSNTYLEDYYGKMRDSLNEGLVSDRFLVEWWITADDVVRRIEGTFQQPRLDKISKVGIINTTESRDGFRKCASLDLKLTNRRLLLEIPSDITLVKEKNMDVAHEWRDVTRRIFETYFSAGYSVYNVASEIKNKERRTYYLLRKDVHENRGS
ncbi:MAG: hypothetical protein HXS41_02705 [Theionarchaea archaeon]|nr:hypothetical protein [Theionarchaea archaeon]MBU7001165.1 hypothetical protein [Theionarchaea archaeon]MBU7019944.1 hypothetical protein [Theionarchaea archaeon]MBU7034036.1 hypothetical protein [Theionarchaea archaeon]MBU7039571.1 hypothetical protein [Theionarchaea archaeon]